MLTAIDIRNAEFSKSMNGYKREEVDDILDKIESDYIQFEYKIAELQNHINSLTNEVNEYKNSQASLQNVLISAQTLADNIVNEAKAKGEKIIDDAKQAAETATAEAKNMLANFDEKLALRRAEAEKLLAVELESAKQKQIAVEKATEDAVKRQQALFDKTRIEVAAFKREVIEQYKRQVELIAKLPDCVAMDAERAAEAVSLKVDEQPDVNKFVKEEPTPEQVLEELVADTADSEEFVSAPIIELVEEETTVAEPISTGFSVNIPEQETEAFEEEEEISFKNKFFSQSGAEE